MSDDNNFLMDNLKSMAVGDFYIMPFSTKLAAKMAFERISTLERERDEARYWLVKLYLAQTTWSIRAEVLAVLGRMDLAPDLHPDAVQALIAKVEGQSQK